nr:odv-e66 [Apis mellifera nudivirus]
MPEPLRNYAFGEQIEDTGIYPNWYKSEIELGNLCINITTGLWYAYHNPNTQDAYYAIAVAEDFIERYEKKLSGARKTQDGRLNRFPWGSNWYQFSITSTSMLAYYLLLPINGTMRMTAVKIINMIMVNPKLSLGFNRDSANMVYMAGPWLLAKYFEGSITSAVESREYKDVLNFVRIQNKTTALDEGLHPDGSFIAHRSIVSPGYFSTLVSSTTLYFYKLDTQIVNSPERQYNTIKRIIFHDKIPIGPIGYSSRSSNMSCKTSELEGDYGIRIMPFARFLRMFTPNLQFSVRAAREKMGYYEADKRVFNTAQYWIHYRNVHTQKSNAECVWPNFGFIQREDQHSLIELPSRTQTTDIYYPTSARSFVMRYDPYGILWQKYQINELAYNVKITECIIIEHTRRIEININIVNESDHGYNYYGAVNSKPTPFSIPSNSSKSFRTIFQLDEKTDTLVDIQTEIMIDDENLQLPITLNKNVVIRDFTNKYVVLYDDDKAKVCAPYELPRETYYLPVKLEYNKHVAFHYNRDVNQYTL